MPSGKVHDQMTVWCGAAAGASGYYLTEYPIELISTFTIGFIFGGLMLSPDLDLKSRPFHRWGYLKVIWLPYQKVAKHRSELSHGILGSWIRMLYLLIIIFAIYCIFYAYLHHKLPNLTADILPQCQPYTFPILIFGLGVWLSCQLHIVADHTYTFIKTKGRRM